MKQIKKSIFYLILILFLHSCNTMSDAGKTLRNEKIKTTDEFLVKKRDPLSLPPDYKNLPQPGSIDLKNKKNEISKILELEENQKIKKSGSSSIEQSIINEIRK